MGLTALLLIATVLPRPTPLLDAMRAQRWEDARRLVESGAEVNERDGLLVTPLMWAIIGGRKELVASLLAAGADPNAADGTGVPCLALAVRNGRPDIVELLCAAGAKPDARGPEDRTALMDAVANRGTTPALVATLLQAGADVNATDRRGLTPLLHVVPTGSPEIATYLLSHGAWPDWRAADGSHAMQLARDYLRRPVADVLCEHGVADADPLPTFQDPAFDFMARSLLRGEVHLLQGLEQAGYPPERQSHGITLLHVAARWGGPDALGTLLELRPRLSLEARDAFGWTPLMHAACSGRTDAVSFLLRQGAAGSSANQFGLGPLDVAIYRGDAQMLLLSAAA